MSGFSEYDNSVLKGLSKITVIFLLLCGLGILGFVAVNIFRVFDLIEKFSHSYFGLVLLNICRGGIYAV